MFVERNIKEAFERVNSFFPIVLVIGARQVGKSTFLRKVAEPSRKYVSLDPLDIQKQAREDPRLFLANNPAPVIFDEIQNVPELLPYIKAVVDEVRQTSPEKAKGMFWLTGSQQFHLMKGVSESLAGRVGILNLYGLSNAELDGRKSQPFLPDNPLPSVPAKSPIEVFTRIWRGSYPEIATANPDTNIWSAFFQSYIQTYLMRDVRALTQVADEHKFYDFLRAVAARTGQMLNYSSLARDADISQPTAESYLSILETSGIVKLLYPYSRNKTRNMVSTPKLRMLDTGLAAFLTGWTSPEVLMNGAMAGAFFESWCVAEILKSYVNAGETPNFYYYRDKDKNEIDLVIERNGKIYPVEFKKAAAVSKSDVKHFNKLSDLKTPVGTGALISLYPDSILIKDTVKTIPAFAL